MIAFIDSKSPALTMTSKEMADLTEKRHDSVKRTIDTLAEKGTIQLPQIVEVTNHLGQTVTEYRIGKRDSYVIVAQLSPEFTARLVDRWQELEANAASVQPTKAIPTEAFKLVPMIVRVARALGLDKNAAAISANQAVTTMTGTNVLQLLGHTHLEAERQDSQWFTPTELGKRIDTSARGLNLLLAKAGMQLKRGEVWEVTGAGREFARLYDTGKKHGSGIPVTQIKLAPSVLPLLGFEKEAA